MLTDPNAEYHLVGYVARIYKTNRKKFNKTAKEWTKKARHGQQSTNDKYCKKEIIPNMMTVQSNTHPLHCYNIHKNLAIVLASVHVFCLLWILFPRNLSVR
eukprot:309956_1